MPAEVMTMILTAIIGAVVTLWKQKQDARAQRDLALASHGKLQAKILKDARNWNPPGVQWTRRVIALLVIFFTLVWPLIVPVLAVFCNTDIPVWISWTETKDGFLFFTSDKNITVWKNMNGVVVTPLHAHSVYAVMGFFFGNQIAK